MSISIDVSPADSRVGGAGAPDGGSSGSGSSRGTVSSNQVRHFIQKIKQLIMFFFLEWPFK